MVPSGLLPPQTRRPPDLIWGSASDDICLRLKDAGFPAPPSPAPFSGLLPAPACQPLLAGMGRVAGAPPSEAWVGGRGSESRVSLPMCLASVPPPRLVESWWGQRHCLGNSLRAQPWAAGSRPPLEWVNWPARGQSDPTCLGARILFRGSGSGTAQIIGSHYTDRIWGFS